AIRFAAVLTLWAVLFLGVCALLGLVGVVAWLQARRRDLLGPTPSPMQTRPTPAYYARLAQEAGELTREAAVAAAGAERAATVEQAARESAEVSTVAAQALVEEAGQAAADAEAARRAAADCARRLHPLRRPRNR